MIEVVIEEQADGVRTAELMPSRIAPYSGDGNLRAALERFRLRSLFPDVIERHAAAEALAKRVRSAYGS